MNDGQKMLKKLEGWLTNKEFAEVLSDAFSTTGYRNGWINCIRMLRKRGYLDCDIESIIRSKITRWAGDESNNRYGFHSANDLARYIDKYPNCLTGLITYDPNSK
jgi:hypothetical protein